MIKCKCLYFLLSFSSFSFRAPFTREIKMNRLIFSYSLSFVCKCLTIGLTFFLCCFQVPWFCEQKRKKREENLMIDNYIKRFQVNQVRHAWRHLFFLQNDSLWTVFFYRFDLLSFQVLRDKWRKQIQNSILLFFHWFCTLDQILLLSIFFGSLKSTWNDE